MNEQNSTLIQASYSPYTGGGLTYATGGAAVATAGGNWYQNPILWLLIIAGAVVLARR